MCMTKDASFFERRAEEMQHLVRKCVKSVVRREDVKRRAVIRVSWARRLEIDSGRSGAGSGLRAAADGEMRAF